MSVQVHAPPTPEEDKAVKAAKRKRGLQPVNVVTWSDDAGWCSACKDEPVLVAHMGHDEFNFALCQACISRLQAEIATPQTGATTEGATEK